MIFTYVIVFLFVIMLAMIVVYTLQTFVLPRRIDEIAQMIEAGQIKQAIKKLTDILEKDDRNSYAHFLLADAYARDNNIKFAIVEYRQVLKYGKYSEKVVEVDVRSRLAKLYQEQGSFDDAKNEYLILTKLEPDNFQNFFELGSIYFRTNTLDRALTFLKKSAALNPRHEQSHYYLGQIYYQTNLYPDAKQCFIESIKIDPLNYRSHYFLGLVLRQMQDYEWAIKEFDIAQKSEDLKVKCFLAKGSCHMQKGMLPKAMMEFERGLKFARKGSDTELGLRYYLAECHEKTRDLHSAIHQWEKIIEVKPNFRDVQAKLKNYAEFRQDDRMKDFLISGLSQFEHTCRKIVEAMNFNITDINIISDTEIEIIGTESEGKWRNTRQTNRLIRIFRDTETIQDKTLRNLHESMKAKNVTRIIVISTGDFSQSAIDFANTRPIELYGKNELVGMLRKF
ncbi:MAG TPA: tetratricopeptide repeat protein [Spirochaetota bacterium]|nr:tetratricopeptide repeat protein [Spirochaetota bacterium]HOD16222.1 tetratricopeptide repeat protein [Spirochaetota bacterium]HPG49435.1 tetratricopeptide repeat protein [Spirochaetota bacterium]HPN11207.1 tetratricopeptide repeat protein [Spirochaetota bacterium]HQL82563.1 tetratricopeptide repeat protein [Spirochaetota bacterium]